MQTPVYPETLWELLVARAQAKPDGVLVEDDRDRTLTAAQWVEWAERVAAGLQAIGVKSDSVVRLAAADGDRVVCLAHGDLQVGRRIEPRAPAPASARGRLHRRPDGV